MKHKTLLLAILSISLGTEAAEWQLVVSGSGVMLSVDRESIVTMKNGHRKAWVEFLYEDLQTSNNGLKFSRALNQSVFDCDGNSVSHLQQAIYGPGEKGADFLGSVKIPAKEQHYTDVIPESLDEHALKFVCRQKLSKK